MAWPAPLLDDFLGKPVWLWLAFIGLVIVLLVLDLGVLNRRAREISASRSLWLSLFYITIACAFGGFVWWELGRDSGMNYFTGFFIEKTLALDNIFVISLIFSVLAVPRHLQHRVLFWGILGVIVLRAIMIGLGAALVERFDWVLLLFGAFLLATGVKLLIMGEKPADMADSPVLRITRRLFRVTDGLHGDRFVVRLPDPATGRSAMWVTPLFVALVMVEVADLIFAVDSVPAIFAITTDPYIVYTSNIFAILGLRALYFALAAMVHRFRYLKPALALVLVFIAGKIFWSYAYGKVDPAFSLSVTLILLAGGVAVSLLLTRDEETAHAAATAPGEETHVPR
ncbi:MAG: TerC family protein [Acetobacteraceae bacterium]